MKYIESAARKIAEVSTSDKIVVEKSTVPVKAAESISQILRANHRDDVKYQVSYSCARFKNSKCFLVVYNFQITRKYNETK